MAAPSRRTFSTTPVLHWHFDDPRQALAAAAAAHVETGESIIVAFADGIPDGVVCRARDYAALEEDYPWAREGFGVVPPPARADFISAVCDGLDAACAHEGDRLSEAATAVHWPHAIMWAPQGAAIRPTHLIMSFERATDLDSLMAALLDALGAERLRAWPVAVFSSNGGDAIPGRDLDGFQAQVAIPLADLTDAASTMVAHEAKHRRVCGIGRSFVPDVFAAINAR